MYKLVKQAIPAAAVFSFIGLSGISLSSIVGGKGAFFGVSNILMPALATSSGIAGWVLFGLYLMIKISTKTTLVTTGIPTLLGLISINTEKPSRMSLFINIIIPIIAMGAFCIHPVGSTAKVYSLFWLIPIIGEFLYQIGFSSIFIRLLTATFVSHAVGSVLWLYLVPSTTATWISLLTIVPAERFVFAASATLISIGIKYIRTVAIVKKKKISF